MPGLTSRLSRRPRTGSSCTAFAAQRLLQEGGLESLDLFLGQHLCTSLWLFVGHRPAGWETQKGPLPWNGTALLLMETPLCSLGVSNAIHVTRSHIEGMRKDPGGAVRRRSLCGPAVE